MQIKKRLQINVVVSVLTVLLIGLVLFLSLYRINKANNLAKIAGDITLISFERVTLRTDYLRTGNERSKEQLIAKQEQLSGLLKIAADNFTRPKDKNIIGELIKNHEVNVKIVQNIMKNRDRKTSATHTDLLEIETEDRLESQLNMKNYETVIHSRKLLESSREARKSTIRIAGAGILAMLLLICAVIVINSWTMGRAITDRVQRLRQGAETIGDGDLDHRIDIKGNDEFARLSAAFDTMASKLQETYNTLKREITERKLVEDQLLKQSMQLQENTAQLKAANREMESFSYSVSHDLRAPLRAIDGYSQMILKKQGDRLDEDTRRQFQVIRDNVDKMGKLIDDLLTFSRFGRQEVAKTDLELDELIREVWGELVTINPGRAMSLKMEQMPAACGDKTLIRQVYSNLLGNAVKFTNTRESAIIEAGSYMEDNEQVYFVRDNGIGFDMKFYNKLFGVFQRLHSDAEYEGTGIGLALVHRIITRHGGRVWAGGKVDKGATFFFTLPASQG